MRIAMMNKENESGYLIGAKLLYTSEGRKALHKVLMEAKVIHSKPTLVVDTTKAVNNEQRQV